MANERLRSAITAADLTVTDVAAQVGVDPKTVERWITKGRLPHRSHRWKTAKLLRTDEAYLWPETADDARTKSASQAEFISIYPNRGAVPHDLWRTLLDRTQKSIDILVYAGLFLPDGWPELTQILSEKARQGTRVRLAFGDPDSQAVRLRGEEEGIGDALGARIRLSLTYLKDAFIPGLEVRQHGTTLYNSIFRFDEDMLVNTHAFGSPAAQSPVLHFRRVPGGRLFDHYIKSFDRVWANATPVKEPPGQQGKGQQQEWPASTT
ncbi:XRE family transcriptional regulator [Carbonactinospora thermoautotrophica]|uniref:helix-turn-helix domain-containing protein n=1 Tax=Carbonactinospora thermoautotrophica TaxID=1469144 RepID=UPI00226D6379|nr:helix-turn-helix domain-containing protein [Carbonactinospora thermoautotrophica]MCX9191328.1 XRE family transcriptional regulator [Carbonactinospora thermoautotrophica]